MMIDNPDNPANSPPVTRTLQMKHVIYSKIKAIAEREQRSFNYIAVRLLEAALQEQEKEDEPA